MAECCCRHQLQCEAHDMFYKIHYIIFMMTKMTKIQNYEFIVSIVIVYICCDHQPMHI